MEVRARDKIFLAFFIPAAIAAAYLYFWRIDAAARLAALEAESANLVTAEDFPLEKRIREAQIPKAQAELENERNATPPEQLVVADAAASIAAREREITRIFGDAGLVVLRCEALPQNDRNPSADALAATGLRQTPLCRRWTLDGTYPAVKRALDAVSRRRLAAIADGIHMRASGFGRWSLDVWM